MKRTTILLACTLLLISASAYGSKECMSNKNKYRTLEYVDCYCPCKQYQRLRQRGECSYCGHYRYPDKWDIKADKKLPQPNVCKKVPNNPINIKLNQTFGGCKDPNTQDEND